MAAPSFCGFHKCEQTVSEQYPSTSTSYLSINSNFKANLSLSGSRRGPGLGVPRRAVDVLPRRQLGRLVPRPLPPVAVAAGAAAAAAAGDAVGVLVGDGDAGAVADVDGGARVFHCGRDKRNNYETAVSLSARGTIFVSLRLFENWRVGSDVGVGVGVRERSNGWGRK